MFDTKLRRVIKMLILASAAIAKITAGRLCPVRRRLDDLDKARAAKTLLDLRQFNIDGFAGRDERDKHNEVSQAADSFAAKGNVINRQPDLLACGGRRNHNRFTPPPSDERFPLWTEAP
jgi:hypothetical protein